MLAAVALACVPAVAQTLSSTTNINSDPIIIQQSPGGQVALFEEEVEEIIARRQHVIVDGPCVSACTMILSVPSAYLCATDSARFGFHMAFMPSLMGHVPNPEGTYMMARHWPAYVSTWLKRHGGLTLDVKMMGAPDIFRMVRRCA